MWVNRRGRPLFEIDIVHRWRVSTLNFFHRDVVATSQRGWCVCAYWFGQHRDAGGCKTTSSTRDDSLISFMLLVSSKWWWSKWTSNAKALVGQRSNSDLTRCFYCLRWNRPTEGTRCHPNVSFRLEWVLLLCPQSAVKNQGVFILKCWDVWVKINMNVSSREVFDDLTALRLYIFTRRENPACRNVKLEGWQWKPEGRETKAYQLVNTHMGWICVCADACWDNGSCWTSDACRNKEIKIRILFFQAPHDLFLWLKRLFFAVEMCHMNKTHSFIMSLKSAHGSHLCSVNKSHLARKNSDSLDLNCSFCFCCASSSPRAGTCYSFILRSRFLSTCPETTKHSQPLGGPDFCLRTWMFGIRTSPAAASNVGALV